MFRTYFRFQKGGKAKKGKKEKGKNKKFIKAKKKKKIDPKMLAASTPLSPPRPHGLLVENPVGALQVVRDTNLSLLARHVAQFATLRSRQLNRMNPAVSAANGARCLGQT